MKLSLGLPLKGMQIRCACGKDNSIIHKKIVKTGVTSVNATTAYETTYTHVLSSYSTILR